MIRRLLIGLAGALPASARADTFTVTVTIDGTDFLPGNGVCETTNGGMSGVPRRGRGVAKGSTPTALKRVDFQLPRSTYS